MSYVKIQRNMSFLMLNHGTDRIYQCNIPVYHSYQSQILIHIPMNQYSIVLHLTEDPLIVVLSLGCTSFYLQLYIFFSFVNFS